MKLFSILVFGCLAVTASSFEEDGLRQHGENGWYVPNRDGSFKWLDKDVAENYLESMAKIDLLRWTINPVKYCLFTRSNPEKCKKISVSNTAIDASNFNPAHPTRFIIHGWMQGHFSSMNRKIRDAWFSKGDFNIIIVDWCRAFFIDYLSSTWAVPKVGEKVAAMIDFLVSNYSMSLHDLHIIGHSLGAHISGYAGKNVKTGQVHTIIGLDPASPLFSYNKPEKRLSSDDAFYVESIQTNGGILGFLKPIGRNTFYPNGGKSQPNCKFGLFICSHLRSFTYYAEAISENKFAAIKCNNYMNAVAKNCGTTYSPIRMGAVTNSLMENGDFYVPVNKKAPYGIMS